MLTLVDGKLLAECEVLKDDCVDVVCVADATERRGSNPDLHCVNLEVNA